MNPRAILVAASMVSLCSSCIKHDLQGMCQLAKDILADPHHSPVQRLALLQAEVKHVAYSAEVRRFVADVNMTRPAERYAAFQTLARAHGQDLTCPEMAIIFNGAARTSNQP